MAKSLPKYDDQKKDNTPRVISFAFSAGKKSLINNLRGRGACTAYYDDRSQPWMNNWALFHPTLAQQEKPDHVAVHNVLCTLILRPRVPRAKTGRRALEMRLWLYRDNRPLVLVLPSRPFLPRRLFTPVHPCKVRQPPTADCNFLLVPWACSRCFDKGDVGKMGKKKSDSSLSWVV